MHELGENDLAGTMDRLLSSSASTISLNRRLMEKAIDTLKPDDQMLLNLYYFDNRPIREIACITERSEGYLHSRLQWIRKKLTITIKNIENNEEN